MQGVYMACNMQRFIKRWQRNNGIDDDTYRAFLHGVTGKRSTTEMSPKERWRVVESLKHKGVRLDPNQHTAKGQKDAQRDDDDQSRLARHLWLLLNGYGVLRDSSEWALLAYVERITGIKRLEWCTHKQITKVIETLKKWVARIERDLILDAVREGKLLLPEGFSDPAAVERALQADSRFWPEALFDFAEARKDYLYTYNPARRAT
jgi:phage gp16-like protein